MHSVSVLGILDLKGPIPPKTLEVLLQNTKCDFLELHHLLKEMQECTKRVCCEAKKQENAKIYS